MKILLDTISKTNVLITFDNTQIINKYEFDVKMNESTRLIEEFETFLKNINLEYKDIKHIIVVNGPGSFTWIRTTTLLVNSINYIIKKNITPINYFQLFQNYPIIKTSSKRDCFVKIDKKSEIKIIPNIEIIELLKEKNIKEIYWDFEIEWINTHNEVNYENIIKNITLEENKLISPFYIKKPSIW